MTFAALDGNSIGLEQCGVFIDPVTIPLLLGSVKWLSSLDLYTGDIEDIYETTQAFERLARRLMNSTPDCELILFPPATVQMYAGVTIPDGWLLCDGSLVSDVNYPNLAAALGVTGSFYLPDLRGKFPLGVSASYPSGATGGEVNHTLLTSEMPSHTHAGNSHNHVVAGHTHTANNHSHTQQSHSHTVEDHTHTTQAHEHSLKVRQTAAAFGTDTRVGTTTASGTLATRQTDPTTVIVNNAGALSTTSTVGGAIDSAAITINAEPESNTSGTVSTVQNTGGGGSHNNMPPYLAMNFIIKV